MRAVLLLGLVVAVSLATCGPPGSGDLDRDDVKALLLEHGGLDRQKRSTVDVLGLDKLEAGQAAGLWTYRLEPFPEARPLIPPIGNAPPTSEQTPPPLKFAAFDLTPAGGALFTVFRVPFAHRTPDGSTSLYGVRLRFKSPLVAEVVEVTGLAPSQLSDAAMDAEFVFRFTGPGAEPMTAIGALEEGKAAAYLRKFDDGWRVAKVRFPDIY